MIRLLSRELNLFLLALGFFSRIPMLPGLHYSSAALNHASRYFGAVGWLLGVIVAAIYTLADIVFSPDISLWLAISGSLLLTGAFHEDGLADTADGLGGAFEREKKLAIMKDSRIGTYGAAALIMALLGKYLLLNETANVAASLLLGYSLSRIVAGSLLFDMTYAGNSQASKSKPLAASQTFADLAVLLLSAVPAIYLLDGTTLAHTVLALLALRFAAKAYLNRQLGGFTGDTLGAVQQVAELGIYLVLLIP